MISVRSVFSWSMLMHQWIDNKFFLKSKNQSTFIESYVESMLHLICVLFLKVLHLGLSILGLMVKHWCWTSLHNNQFVTFDTMRFVVPSTMFCHRSTVMKCSFQTTYVLWFVLVKICFAKFEANIRTLFFCLWSYLIVPF